MSQEREGRSRFVFWRKGQTAPQTPELEVVDHRKLMVIDWQRLTPFEVQRLVRHEQGVLSAKVLNRLRTGLVQSDEEHYPVIEEEFDINFYRFVRKNARNRISEYRDEFARWSAATVAHTLSMDARGEYLSANAKDACLRSGLRALRQVNKFADSWHKQNVAPPIMSDIYKQMCNPEILEDELKASLEQFVNNPVLLDANNEPGCNVESDSV